MEIKLYDRTFCQNEKADAAETIANLSLAPCVLAFGKKVSINDKFEELECKTPHKIVRIVAQIFYVLLFPVTLPLTLIGIVAKNLSLSYSKVENGSNKPKPQDSVPEENNWNASKSKLSIPAAKIDSLSSIKMPKKDPVSEKTGFSETSVQADLTKWVWPADLSKLGLSKTEKDQIEAFLKEVVPQVIVKQEIPKLQSKGVPFELYGKNWILPRTITFFGKDNHELTDIVIFLNKDHVGTVGSGANRVAKFWYNLTTGDFCVKKRLMRKYECQLMEQLWDLNPTGVPHIIGMRTKILDKKTAGKVEVKDQVIETLYDGTLVKLLNGKTKIPAHAKALMIHALLTALKTTHEHACSTDTPDGLCKPFNSFHADIKPSNVLFKKMPDGTYQVVLTDFDYADKIDFLSGTPGFFCPAYVKFWRDLKAGKTMDIADINLKYAQKQDLWAMGLIIAAILKNRMSTKHPDYEVAPLNCIANNIHPASDRIDEMIEFLSQNSMDSELNAIKAGLSDDPDREILLPLWDIAVKLLKVDPLQTITAEESQMLSQAVISALNLETPVQG